LTRPGRTSGLRAQHHSASHGDPCRPAFAGNERHWQPNDRCPWRRNFANHSRSEWLDKRRCLDNQSICPHDAACLRGQRQLTHYPTSIVALGTFELSADLRGLGARNGAEQQNSSGDDGPTHQTSLSGNASPAPLCLRRPVPYENQGHRQVRTLQRKISINAG
jgi:hypothetical protein